MAPSPSASGVQRCPGTNRGQRGVKEGPKSGQRGRACRCLGAVAAGPGSQGPEAQGPRGLKVGSAGAAGGKGPLHPVCRLGWRVAAAPSQPTRDCTKSVLILITGSPDPWTTLTSVIAPSGPVNLTMSAVVNPARSRARPSVRLGGSRPRGDGTFSLLRKHSHF